MVSEGDCILIAIPEKENRSNDNVSCVTVVNRETVRPVLWSWCVTWLARGVVTTTLLLLLSAAAGAQGVTTAGIRGSVSADDRRTVDARVNVSHDATGVSVEVHT